MGKFYDQMKGIWGKMEVPQRVSMVLIGLVFIGILVAVVVGASQPDFTLLASRLSQAETARIATYLSDQNVPYRLADNDTAILVPRGERYKLLNVLSEQEMLSDESDGFELLAHSSMGESTFMEQKKYDRALAGELERIIREVDGVQGAKVIVNRPKETPFLADEGQASAAVKVKMVKGRKLSKQQLAGVVHLVSGALGGVGHDHIQVMDDKGLLTQAEADEGAMSASTSLEAERAVEKHLSSKAQELLDRVLGPGRSLVTLSVDLDFTKRRSTSTTLTDPVVIESITRETDESTPIPGIGGQPGTATNVEGAAGGGGPPPEPATKTTADEVKKYSTGTTNSTKDDEIGRVQGMTVSILLDHERKDVTKKDEAGNDVTETTYQAFSAEDQDRFKKLVLDAIGFEAAKGIQKAIDPKSEPDARFTVTVQSMRMHVEDAIEVTTAASFDMAQLDIYIRYGLAAIVALALLFIGRGQLKRSHAAWEAEQTRREEMERQQAEAAATVTPEEEAKKVEEMRMSLRQQIQQQIEEDPETAAAVLRGWIHSAS